MKKKLTRLFLLFIITCLAACNLDKIPEYTLSAEDIQTVNLPPTTESPPIEILTPSYDATIEYGDPDLITDNTGPLWAYIRFPIAGDETDDIITEWAHSVYQNACDEIAGLSKGDPQAEGEINVQFDSYLVNGRYAGILENGMFMTSHLAHPLSIVRTFNIDTKSKVFLENSDILDHSRLESIFSVMRDRITEELPDAADYLGEMDEKWLDHIAIGHDGIIVVLERGMFLPAYLGAQKVVLPYEQLGSAFLLGAAPKPPSEPPVAPPAGPPAGPHPAEPPMKSPTTPPTAPPVGPSVGSPATETPAAPATDPPAETPEAPAPEPPAETPEAPAPEPPANPAIRDNIDPLKPMIALTFDDGPSKHTPKILDTLEKYDARVTFCVVGNLVAARKDTVKRAFDLGCEIIGHSWDHRNLSKLSAEEIKKELNNTNAIIESVTGVSSRLYRPPYGAVSSTLKSVSAELDYAIIYWSLDPLDWKYRNADRVYNTIMADASNRAIVLSHDLHGTTADAMVRVIPDLIAKGYQLVTVSELMYYADKTLEAGVVYYSGK